MDSPSPARNNESTTPSVSEEQTPSCASTIPSPPNELEESTRLIHELLARQLEYYFSTANLAKDTYVSTLRSLNDGYVPISIIANFGKVRTLVPPELAVESVRRAATDFSDLLEVVEVDATTGKRVVIEKESSKKIATSILAVGPVTGKPIPTSLRSSSHDAGQLLSTPAPEKLTISSSLAQAVPSSAERPVQNTVILREAPEGTDEETIRSLFQFESCPGITSVHLDLQNCWFVTLDTSSRDTMVNVMFQLRTMKFPSGESVKARLKSTPAASVSPSPVAVPTLSAFYNHEQAATMMFAPTLLPVTGTNHGSASVGGKKKRGSNKNRGNGGNNKSKNQGQQQQQQQQLGENHSNKSQKSNGPSPKRNGVKEGSRQASSKATTTPGTTNKGPEVGREPPAMDEKAFPCLPPSEDSFASGNMNKIEVEKVPDQRSDIDDDELFEKGRGNAFSDSSSTATASTSSTPSQMPQPNLIVGGYAAALMKTTTAAPSTMSVTNSQTKPKNVFVKNGAQTSSAHSNEKPKDKPQENKTSPPAAAVNAPSWGKGRSFADVLRQEQAV